MYSPWEYIVDFAGSKSDPSARVGVGGGRHKCMTCQLYQTAPWVVGVSDFGDTTISQIFVGHQSKLRNASFKF